MIQTPRSYAELERQVRAVVALKRLSESRRSSKKWHQVLLGWPASISELDAHLAKRRKSLSFGDKLNEADLLLFRRLYAYMQVAQGMQVTHGITFTGRTHPIWHDSFEILAEHESYADPRPWSPKKWRKALCSRMVLPSSIVDDRFRQAARLAIREDTNARRVQIMRMLEQGESMHCFRTGEPLLPGAYFEIDHVGVEFAEIVSEFISNEAIDHADVKYCSGLEGSGAAFEDPALATRFRDFHNRLAQLEASSWDGNRLKRFAGLRRKRNVPKAE